MAIIATLTKAEEHKTYWKMEIEYNDEGDLVYETLRFRGATLENLKAHAIAKVNQHEEIKTFDFTTIVGASIDITPTPPTEPTAAEIAKDAWFKNYRQLKEVNALLAQAPAISTASRIQFRDNLQSTVESNWLDTYLGDL